MRFNTETYTMNAHKTVIITLFALFLSGCATGPSIEELRAQEQLEAKAAAMQIELQKIQSNIRSGNITPNLTSEQISEIATIVNNINAIIQRNNPDASLKFDKINGLLSYSKGGWSWTTPITKLGCFGIITVGIALVAGKL
jgi:hypothetical protein